MLTPKQKYEVCRMKSGVAYFPLTNSPYFSILISTRFNNLTIGEIEVTTVKNYDYSLNILNGYIYQKAFAVNFTGNEIVNFKGGLKDVYSLQLSSFNDGGTIYNIQDFENFIKQFHNIHSFVTRLRFNQSIVKGNLAKIPDSMERIYLNFIQIANQSDLYLNVSGFSTSSNLKHLLHQNDLLLLNGDLAKIPNLVNFFKVGSLLTGSSITYTAGKVWASSFDTLSIPLALSHTELDNLLIDMNNSITTKMGAGVIAIGGYRSVTSDAAVTSLQAKGFTVDVNRGYQILNLPFENSFADSGEMGMTMVAGGASNQPTFALSGRKAGEYCAVFNGSQSIKTTTNLPINSDKVTVAFWMKTTQTAYANIVEISTNYNSNNAFLASINDTLANRVGISDHTTSPAGYNIGNSAVNINNGNWFHVVLTIDRNLGVTQNQIYINGSLSYTQNASYVANLVGNFVNNILFIGQRAGSTAGFNGSLTKLKLYNYTLTAGEVSTLYNSEL